MYVLNVAIKEKHILLCWNSFQKFPKKIMTSSFSSPWETESSSFPFQPQKSCSSPPTTAAKRTCLSPSLPWFLPQLSLTLTSPTALQNTPGLWKMLKSCWNSRIFQAANPTLMLWFSKGNISPRNFRKILSCGLQTKVQFKMQNNYQSWWASPFEAALQHKASNAQNVEFRPC